MRRNLDDLVHPDASVALPLALETEVSQDIPPRALDNLAKLKKLGILNGDVLMSLIAQAPIDPVNLMGTLMQLLPDGWAFSAIDFSMMRALAQDDRKRAVTAAMHVDLMGNAINFLARNRADQLVVFKSYTVEPGPTTWDDVQALMRETIAAAEREAAAP